jgi:4-amino-4-deoxy-L-arabinose transferase-like glycosyltransferase
VAVGVFVIALLLRLLFVGVTLASNTDADVRGFNGDTLEYLWLGETWRETGGYVPELREGDPVSVHARNVSLVRTPLYPGLVGVALWVEDALGLGPSEYSILDKPSPEVGPGGRLAYALVFFVQAVGDAALASVAALLAWRLWRSRTAAFVAGGVMAFSPSAWGGVAVILTDGLFAAFAVAGLWLSLRAATRAGWTNPVAAGVFFALALWAKPTVLFWPIALPVFWFFALGLRRGDRAAWGRLSLIALPLVASIVGWIGHNRLVHGVAAFSVVPERNLMMMISPVVDARVASGGEPVPYDEIWSRYEQAKEVNDGWIYDHGLSVAEAVQRRRAYANERVRVHPRVAAGVYLDNLVENVMSGWTMFDKQLPTRTRAVRRTGVDVPMGQAAPPGEPRSLLTRVARLALAPLFAIEQHVVVRVTFWSLAVAGLLLAVTRRSTRGPALACGLFVLYLLVTAATTYGQGSRILYPAFAPAAALAAGLVTLLPQRRSSAKSDGASP